MAERSGEEMISFAVKKASEIEYILIIFMVKH